MHGYACSTFHELWKQICDYTIAYNIIKWSVDVSVCRRFGVSTFWPVDVLVCRRFVLSTFRLVDVLVCRRFGLSTFRFVDVLVCRRFGLSTFRFVDVLVCRRLVVDVSVCRCFDRLPKKEATASRPNLLYYKNQFTRKTQSRQIHDKLAFAWRSVRCKSCFIGICESRNE